MSRTAKQLHDDLFAIWNAALDGVRIDRLMHNAVALRGNELVFDGQAESLETFERIVVLGGGKASGAMAETLESILEPIADTKKILGWVNVPEDCLKPLRHIHLHPARPAGINEPTQAGILGTDEILRLAENLNDNDLCVCLISGGGSALLPAPISGVTLNDKQEVTRFLSESGASIQELNTVRKQISRIKGGGLKRLCIGKRLICLILSDVLGDPLDVIASGPTVDNTTTPQDALEILFRFAPDLKENCRSELPRRFVLRRIVQALQKKIAETMNQPVRHLITPQGFVRNIIIGNNALAVASAGDEALRRGYSATMYVSPKSNETAEQTGVFLAKSALEMKQTGSDCFIHGGEPVVQLAPPEIRGKGGRNQQLVLAALDELLQNHFWEQTELKDSESFGIAFLSGGTDGEDGPTDAAGAWFDPFLLRQLWEQKKNAPNFSTEDYLRRNDAYHFFEPLGMLLKTGATGTNVCDVRIVLVDRFAAR